MLRRLLPMIMGHKNNGAVPIWSQEADKWPPSEKRRLNGPCHRIFLHPIFLLPSWGLRETFLPNCYFRLRPIFLYRKSVGTYYHSIHVAKLRSAKDRIIASSRLEGFEFHLPLTLVAYSLSLLTLKSLHRIVRRSSMSFTMFTITNIFMAEIGEKFAWPKVAGHAMHESPKAARLAKKNVSAKKSSKRISSHLQLKFLKNP